MASSPTFGTPDPDRDAGRRYPRFRPGDVVLVAAAIAAAALVAFRHHGGAGSLTIGAPSGESSLALPSDTAFQVQGRLGPVTVEVAGREARISVSPCPGQQCVNTGWISVSGEASVCAPSAVWIRLEGGDGEAPDAVSY